MSTELRALTARKRVIVHPTVNLNTVLEITWSTCVRCRAGVVLAQCTNISARKFVYQTQRALSGRCWRRAQSRHTVEEIIKARRGQNACRRRAFVAFICRVDLRRCGSGEVTAFCGFYPCKLSVILWFCSAGSTCTGFCSAFSFPPKVSVVKHLFTVGV